MKKTAITTARLSLRPVTEADAERIAAIGGDWDVASMTARMPYPYTVASAYQWIDGLQDDERVFGIDLDGELIGITGYSLSSDRRGAEVGYWLGKAYWGKGFATEAARAVIAYCFRHERVRVITCGHFLDNPASGRVIEKLGFAETGVGEWWCEARRMSAQAKRYELVRPPAWSWPGLPSLLRWHPAG